MSAWRGSSSRPFQYVGEESIDDANDWLGIMTAAQKGGINCQGHSGSDREWSPLLGIQHQLDGSRRKAKIAEPGIALDGFNVVVPIVGI